MKYFNVATLSLLSTTLLLRAAEPAKPANPKAAPPAAAAKKPGVIDLEFANSSGGTRIDAARKKHEDAVKRVGEAKANLEKARSQWLGKVSEEREASYKKAVEEETKASADLKKVESELAELDRIAGGRAKKTGPVDVEFANSSGPVTPEQQAKLKAQSQALQQASQAKIPDAKKRVEEAQKKLAEAAKRTGEAKANLGKLQSEWTKEAVYAKLDGECKKAIQDEVKASADLRAAEAEAKKP